jgi:hypothetical protein
LPLTPHRAAALAAALAKDESGNETVGPNARLAEVLLEREPEFHPLDVACTDAQICWSLTPSPTASLANAVVLDRIAAIMKDHPTAGLSVGAVVSGAEASMPAAIASHFVVEAKGSASAYFAELRRLYSYVALMRASACVDALAERGVDRKRMLPTSATVHSPSENVHVGLVFEAVPLEGLRTAWTQAYAGITQASPDQRARHDLDVRDGGDPAVPPVDSTPLAAPPKAVSTRKRVSVSLDAEPEEVEVEVDAAPAVVVTAASRRRAATGASPWQLADTRQPVRQAMGGRMLNVM